MSILIQQVQICKHVLCGSFALVFRNTAGLNPFPKEVLYRITVDIVECSTVVGDVVPRPPHLLQDKLLKCRSTQFLHRAARAIVVFAPVADGDVAGFHFHFNVF